jgi:hypothetical protein
LLLLHLTFPEEKLILDSNSIARGKSRRYCSLSLASTTSSKQNKNN